MSSISQIERSSSQTKMLPTRSSCCGRRRVEERRGRLICGHYWGRRQTLTPHEATQAKHKHAPLAQLGARPDLAFVGLDDLVDDRQTKTRATFELRLKRFEYLLDELLAHSRASIGEIDLP